MTTSTVRRRLATGRAHRFELWPCCSSRCGVPLVVAASSGVAVTTLVFWPVLLRRRLTAVGRGVGQAGSRTEPRRCEPFTWSMLCCPFGFSAAPRLRHPSLRSVARRLVSPPKEYNWKKVFVSGRPDAPLRADLASLEPGSNVGVLERRDAMLSVLVEVLGAFIAVLPSVGDSLNRRIAPVLECRSRCRRKQ